jgi:hypothetical protein
VTEFGPEILPGTPEYQWASRVIKAVEERTGLPSRWNGRLYQETDPYLLGTAHDDGSLTLSPRVLEAMRTAYAAGAEATPQQCDDARQAMAIAVHEARHLCNQLGPQDDLLGSVKLYDPDEIALEEGLVDTWAHRHVDGVIQQLDMDRAVPGVIGANAVVSYSAYTKGTDALVNGLADVTGVQPDEVRGQLHDTPRTQRWGVAADLVIDQRLDGVVPPDHRDQIKGKLQTAMRVEFASLQSVQLSGLLDQRGLESYGRATGQAAVGALNRTLSDIETHYYSWRDQQGPDAQHEDAPRMDMSMQEIMRERQQAKRQAAGQAADPEIESLRKFLGDHRPVAQAPAPGAAEARASSAGQAPVAGRQARVKQEHGQSKE